jgi:hypothetical protein
MPKTVRLVLFEVLVLVFESSWGRTALTSGLRVGPQAQQIATFTSTADQMAISRLSSEIFGLLISKAFYRESIQIKDC